MTNAKREVGLKYYADVNPLTKEFKDLPDGEEVAFLPLENIWSGGAADYSRTRSWKKSDTSYTQFRRGDVLVPKVTPTVFHGRTMVAETETEVGLATSEVHVLRPKDGVDRRWIAYSMLSSQFLDCARGAVYGVGGLQRISAGYLGGYRVPETDTVTQQRIADYLDRETAEIDAAVADLDRYVQLLEKRRLLTVDEVLHSSGVEVSVLPEIPLKFIIQERFVGDWGDEPGTTDVDSACVRVADFDRSTNTVNDQVPTIRSYSREKYEAKRLRYHDILVERSGGGEKTPVGSAILYTGGDEALCANFIEVVRLKEDQLPEYWVHVLRREYMGRNTMRFVKQTTGIQNLDPQGFYDQKFPIPSLVEQRRLAADLRERTLEVDSLIADSTKLRELLLKRRSILITDVVTGRKQV